MQLNTIKAITFDFTGTLANPYPGVGAIYAEVLQAHGFEGPSLELGKRFYHVFQKHTQAPREPITEVSEKALWKVIMQETISPYCPESHLDTVFDTLWLAFADARRWQLLPYAKEVLEFLNAHGYRIAILSNWDARLRPLIQDLGLGHLIPQIFISTEAGAAKPSVHFFQHVQEQLKLRPEQILHVGDSLYQDHQAARKAGWQSVLLSPKLGQRVYGNAIKDLSGLPALLAPSKGNALYGFTRRIENMVADFRELPINRSGARIRRMSSIGALVDKLISKHNINQVRLESIIMEHWKNLLGPERAHRCVPQKITKDQSLIILTSNATLRNELFMSRNDLLEKIQQLPGCQNLKSVIVRAG